MPPPPPPPPPEKWLDSKVSVFVYLCLCLNVFFFSYLSFADHLAYYALLREDYWVENLTAFWFLLAGLLLFVTARVERSFLRRCVYILGGIAMVFAAGEEISWGQRVFEFATPDFLVGLNAQNEFNVHNIFTGTFDRIYMEGTLVLCTVTFAAFFCRKDTLFGIPLPSILLTLGFLVMLSQRPVRTDTDIVHFILLQEKALLLLFVIYTLLSRQAKLFIATAATVALVLASSYIAFRSGYSAQEVREHLFGIVCFVYAFELLLAQGRLAASSWAPFNGLKLPGGRVPLLRGGKHRSGISQEASFNSPGLSLTQEFSRSLCLKVCSFVILCSIGLALFGYFNQNSTAAMNEKIHQSIVSSEPVIRSNFDVYFIENWLTYVKDPCGPADIKERFFLHVVPVDEDDLPYYRKQYGFDNLDFDFRDHSSIAGGKCIATVHLPYYAVARIQTGQFILDGNQIWAGTFDVP